MSDFVVHDSGERRKFKSGAVRDMVEGKGRYDLISPFMKRRLAKHLEMGAKKYDPHNWEKGIPFSSALDSAMRHLDDYQEGLRDEDHLSAAIFNIMMLVHFEEMIDRNLLPASLNDLPTYVPIYDLETTDGNEEDKTPCP